MKPAELTEPSREEQVVTKEVVATEEVVVTKEVVATGEVGVGGHQHGAGPGPGQTTQVCLHPHPDAIDKQTNPKFPILCPTGN